ncbi:MAG: hypothetical protein ACRC1X_10065 [Lactobacillus panisapium]
MKKMFLSSYLLIISIILMGCGKNQNNSKRQVEEQHIENLSYKSNKSLKKEIFKYKKSVKYFTRLRVDEIYNKFDKNEGFYLYIGRATCPYCRIFEPKLKEAAKNSTSKIYYLDVENIKKNSKEDSFIKGTGLKYIPALLYINSKTDPDFLKFKSSKKLTVYKIEKFIRKYN